MLALYRYEDKELRKLHLGQWFNCKHSSVDEIDQFLKNDFRRARLKKSNDILNALAERKIGTRDSKIIDKIIAPNGSRYFELRIWWKDKDDHFSMVINSAKLEQEVKVCLTDE